MKSAINMQAIYIPIEKINTETKNIHVKYLLKKRILMSTTKMIVVKIVILTNHKLMSQPSPLIKNPYEILNEKKYIKIEATIELKNQSAMTLVSKIRFFYPT